MHQAGTDQAHGLRFEPTSGRGATAANWSRGNGHRPARWPAVSQCLSLSSLLWGTPRSRWPRAGRTITIKCAHHAVAGRSSWKARLCSSRLQLPFESHHARWVGLTRRGLTQGLDRGDPAASTRRLRLARPLAPYATLDHSASGRRPGLASSSFDRQGSAAASAPAQVVRVRSAVSCR